VQRNLNFVICTNFVKPDISSVLCLLQASLDIEKSETFYADIKLGNYTLTKFSLSILYFFNQYYWLFLFNKIIKF